MQLNNDIIQAYLWYDVIRLGFSPSGNKDIKSWLQIYVRSLKDFWEIDGYPLPPKGKGNLTVELSITTFDITLSISITNIAKFVVKFSSLKDSSNTQWTHDVDSFYFVFPDRSLLSKYGKRPEAITKMSAYHVKKVLNGLIFHPMAHQHVKTNSHCIRIGGGINNPFLYLFHLRYQLCPDKSRREKEIQRLIPLFESAIKSDAPVTANELLLRT